MLFRCILANPRRELPPLKKRLAKNRIRLPILALLPQFAPRKSLNDPECPLRAMTLIVKQSESAVWLRSRAGLQEDLSSR